MKPGSAPKHAVVGIDAAWTSRAPSGVAVLWQDDEDQWHCGALAPSYVAFQALATQGTAVDWIQPTQGSTAEPKALLAAARKLLPARSDHVISVAIDMPMATVPVVSRRLADDEISRTFGGGGCGTHSPTPARPGALGQSLVEGFLREGLELAVHGTVARPARPYLIEVFPHPALLSLLNAEYRVPYKVGKARRYWPERSIADRIALVLDQFERILSALRAEIADISLTLPPPASVRTLSELKRFEDALDALVAGWVGIQFLAGSAVPHGDATAAIWCPRRVR